MRKRNGFTLAELIGVIVVLALTILKNKNIKTLEKA